MRYFAYGLNMDRDGMAARCLDARLLGPERLAGYRFVIARAGYAGLVPDAASAVYGVLWELSPRDVLALDAFEGVTEGLYRQITLSIAQGPALVYVPSDAGSGVPQPGYLATVIAAARSHGLPSAYVRELETWIA